MKNAGLLLLFSLILCASAFSEETGVIQCEPGSTEHVPASISPGGNNVIEQLTCGQMVSIVGLERGYVKIQIGERIGYVNAKYVRLMDQPAFESPNRFAVSGMFTWTHRFDHGSYNFPGGFVAYYWLSPINFVGWDATFVGKVSDNFALEGGVSGNYWLSPVNFVATHYYTLSGGPRVMFPSGRITPYLHFLIGLARGTGVGGSWSVSDNALLLSPGFGIDVDINRRFAVRMFQVDFPVFRARGEWSSKTMRIGGGLVVKF